MNTQLTKLNKRISEQMLELQATEQEVDALIHKVDVLIHRRWEIEKQIQQLLRGDDEIPEAQVVERRTVEAAGRHH